MRHNNKTGGSKMKRIIALSILAVLLSAPVCMSISEKEEAELRISLNRERLARIEAQSIIMQRDYESAKATLQSDEAKLRKLVEKEKKEVKK